MNPEFSSSPRYVVREGQTRGQGDYFEFGVDHRTSFLTESQARACRMTRAEAEEAVDTFMPFGRIVRLVPKGALAARNHARRSAAARAAQ